MLPRHARVGRELIVSSAAGLSFTLREPATGDCGAADFIIDVASPYLMHHLMFAEELSSNVADMMQVSILNLSQVCPMDDTGSKGEIYFLGQPVGTFGGVAEVFDISYGDADLDIDSAAVSAVVDALPAWSPEQRAITSALDVFWLTLIERKPPVPSDTAAIDALSARSGVLGYLATLPDNLDHPWWWWASISPGKDIRPWGAKLKLVARLGDEPQAFLRYPSFLEAYANYINTDTYKLNIALANDPSNLSSFAGILCNRVKAETLKILDRDGIVAAYGGQGAATFAVADYIAQSGGQFADCEAFAAQVASTGFALAQCDSGRASEAYPGEIEMSAAQWLLAKNCKAPIGGTVIIRENQCSLEVDFSAVANIDPLAITETIDITGLQCAYASGSASCSAIATQTCSSPGSAACLGVGGPFIAAPLDIRARFDDLSCSWKAVSVTEPK